MDGARMTTYFFIAWALATCVAPPAHADTVGAVCPDSLWMKLTHDSATGQEMVCGGAYPDPHLTWQATGKPPATLFAASINLATGSEILWATAMPSQTAPSRTSRTVSR